MEGTNIIRNLIRKELKGLKMLNEWESGDYPAGAEHDSRAPWNQKDEPGVTYMIDYRTQTFDVSTGKGYSYSIPFDEVLNQYWEDNKFSYEDHLRLFGNDEDTMDAKIIQMLKNENFDFGPYLKELDPNA